MAARFTLARGSLPRDDDDELFDVLDGIPASWSWTGGALSIWVEDVDAEAARLALAERGLPVEEREEPARDWVAEAAALQKPVSVGRYVLDPHGSGAVETVATPAPSSVDRGSSRHRLFVPARRAFGTGSHESTRLALRLLLGESVSGARVLDVGCGTGALAFVAAFEGARSAVAFDIDPDAAFAARELGRENGVPCLRVFAGALSALRTGPSGNSIHAASPPGAGFDLAIANMIAEELAPLLAGLHGLLRPGGRLVTSGQLLANESGWLSTLRSEGFRPVKLVSEGEWLGTVSVRS